MASENESRAMARELISKYGSFIEARCESRDQIDLVFNGATVQVPFFQFGYCGMGPRCFHVFLEAVGVNITLDKIEKLRAPATIKVNGHISTGKKNEGKNKGTARIQIDRHSSGQCTICGQPLNFFKRLFKVTRHKTCTSFKE